MSELNQRRLPEGAWDSHIHIIDRTKFPLPEKRPFTPKSATVDDCRTFMDGIGVDHVCIIACSPYGTDNACMVDALKRLEGKARGIAYIDPETIQDEEIDMLHEAGVRGVRINLWGKGQTLEEGMWEGLVNSYVKRLWRHNWILQIYLSLDQVQHLVPIVPTLGIPVVFDHLVCPKRGTVPSSQAGYDSLHQLLKSNANVYVKMSGAYRHEGVPGLDDHMRALLEAAPNQIVWASDWPHTGGQTRLPDGDPMKEQEFMKPDIRGFLDKCIDMAMDVGGEELVQKIWVDNPRRLWNYDSED